MNNLINTEKNLPQKSLAELKVEIKFHLGQMAGHAVEIGNLLIEAKEQVEHGGWAKWLEDNFQLKERMARNFMQVAERFGKRHLNADLNQTQLITLLALPEGEEEKFIAEKKAEGNPVEDMTVKNLQAEVAKWKADYEQKKSEVENLFHDNENLKSENERLEKIRGSLNNAINDTRKTVDALTIEKNDLEQQLKNQKPIEKLPDDYEPTKKERDELKEKIAVLEKQLKEKPIDIATEYPKDYEPMKKELAKLKAEYDEMSQTAVIVQTFETISRQIDSVVYSPFFGKALAYYEKTNNVEYSKFVARLKDFTKVVTED